MPTTRSTTSAAAQDAPPAAKTTADLAPVTTTATGSANISTATRSTPATRTAVMTSEESSAATTTWTHGTTRTVTESSCGQQQQEEPARRSTSGRGSDGRLQSKRRQMLEAQERVALDQMELARATAALARSKLTMMALADEEENKEDADSDVEEIGEKSEEVSKWVQTTTEAPLLKTAEEDRPPPASAAKETKSDAQQWAEAVVKVISATPKVGAAAPGFMHDLPAFHGNTGEWIAFKTVYEDTAPLFTSAQNMARLRKAVQGAAMNTVGSTLYSGCSPGEVMETLRRRYGRPDALVMAEIEKLKNLPCVSDDPAEMCQFAGWVNNAIIAVKALERVQYLEAPQMLNIIVDKLPRIIQYKWFNYALKEEKRTSQERVDLLTMSKFLNKLTDQCSLYTPREKPKRSTPIRHGAHAANEGEYRRPESSREYYKRPEPPQEERKRSEPTCAHCGSEHNLLECSEFHRAPMKQRWASAKKSRLCFRCLQGRHRKEECTKPLCKKCRRPHHISLHEGEKAEEKKPAVEVAHNLRAASNAVKNSRAYLKMIPVIMYGPKGSKRVLALLDEGSTVTLIEASVAQDIGLQGPKQRLLLETVGGKGVSQADSMKLDIRVRGAHQGRKQLLKGARTVVGINLSPQHISLKRVKECAHLRSIAEQLYYKSETPQMLIGQDNWELIVTRALKKGPRGQPVASLTNLGWVLHGVDGANGLTTCAISAHIREDHLDEVIREHFSLESLGVAPRRPTTDAEERAAKVLEATSKRLPNGQFEVGLIWRNDVDRLPDNKSMAENRLRSIEKKCKRDPELQAEYAVQIQNLLDSGYAEEVGDTTPGGWYLPHFMVTHPTKLKKRLVFDAAAKYNGKSLNDALLSGPDLLQSLFGVLLRFRQWPVAVVADIKEMFLRVKVREEDRDYLRFLWRRGTEKEPRTYRMTSLIFGATCSPSAAIYVKDKNAEEFAARCPEAARAIKRNHYMDDYLHSFQTIEEAIKVSQEVDMIHKAAGLHLRGWASNDMGLLAALGQETQNDSVELGNKEEKTLGLRWLPGRDGLGFSTSLRNVRKEVVMEETRPTKREVTSAVMATFDPLGLVTPVVIQGKKLIQDIWRSGVGWDEKIRQEDDNRWKEYRQSLHQLSDLVLPRCVARHGELGELHVFSDASETAYACAVYWRQQRGDGMHDVALLAGKARVTPIKPVSVPRLELQAALLGTRMAQSIKEEMDLRPSRTVYWTDSTTVLAWIKADPRTFKTFVAHRLAEIEDTTRPQQWRWVPTKVNPADDATRGVPAGFCRTHRWFTGPEFLQGSEDSWPQPKVAVKAEFTGEEKEASAVAVAREMEFPTPPPERFSSWIRLVRATARVLQFVARCRGKKVHAIKRTTDPSWRKVKKAKSSVRRPACRKGPEKTPLPLETELLRSAEQLLLSRSQAEVFREELGLLKAQKSLPGHSRLKKLAVVTEDGLIKVHGRIDAAEGIGPEQKRPILLCAGNKITRLIMEHYHRELHHGNHATVMNELRQRFWILGLRSAIRKVARQCQWCRVHRGKPTYPPTGDLPKERLQHGSPPFSNAAVDYFGPMMVTVGRRREKRWGALFTCMTTRAVHVELVPSLSSDSMIMALRRMAARRGMPVTLYSDNGTNFVGARKELAEAAASLNNEVIAAEAETLGVRWKFIPPGAPNMGGAWERLVRSIKTALEVTLKERCPPDEVLHTLVVEAEHIVNSRPLIDECEGQEEAITPNHFLIGRSCGARRLGFFGDENLIGKRSWKVAQRLSDHFWARWVKEYLPTLLPRKIDGRPNSEDLRVGDVVLIVDSTLPRCVWPRGQVVRVLPGPDGRTRVVEVRTSGGVLRRPARKAILLVPAASAVQEDGAAHEGENVADASSVETK